MTVLYHQRSTVHSVHFKSVFLEMQNKAIRPILSDLVTYGTNQLQLKCHTRVLLCEHTRAHECVRSSVPHVSTHVYFCSNIIIINLHPLSINFMVPYPFCQSSVHAKWF